MEAEDCRRWVETPEKGFAPVVPNLSCYDLNVPSRSEDTSVKLTDMADKQFMTSWVIEVDVTGDP